MARAQKRLDLKAIGLRIRELRGDIQQEEFAPRLGISQSQLSKLERGKKVPHLEVLTRITELFAVSLDWIVWGK